ncbi:Membrane-associated phosphatidylinositol transfer protein 2 [Cichlidogyrus casuarinus]|uniref:Membrane-associated phosphatidylinositol transfer protein 2 n=1 Tax=Cichlidogyrus casuarinus TaxID=1844966 RepID=A0ABD2PPE9_9PLAT
MLFYSLQKKSREESVGADSGVEILKNEPYENGPGGNGQYTHKIYHVGRHLPSWFASLFSKNALSVEEEAWNAYPYTKTRFLFPIIKQFSLEVETYYFDDDGRQENVFQLSNEEKKKRIVDFMDIVNDPLDSIDAENPLKYQSKVTGRGELQPNWREEHYASQTGTNSLYPVGGSVPSKNGLIHRDPMPKRIMCAYKLCKVEFAYWGIQSKCEQFIHDIGAFPHLIILFLFYSVVSHKA